MLNISNRERIIVAMDETLQLMKDRATYYNLQNKEEVQVLFGKLQSLRDELQQKNDKEYAILERDNEK